MVSLLNIMHTWIMDLKELQDPRTKGDLFLACPFTVIVVIGVYVYIFKKLGPQLMKHRAPFHIQNILMVYNAFQILFNSYIAVKSTVNIWSMKNPFSEKIEFSNSPQSLEIVRISRLYMYLKFFDLLDTLFFLLRKSYRRISFLHLYHHGGMVLLVWVWYKFYGGDGIGHWIIMINSIVHVVMHTYYLLTSIDVKWKSSVMFKRTFIQIQLIQFLLFSMIFARMVPTYNITLLILTSMFFVQHMFKKLKE